MGERERPVPPEDESTTPEAQPAEPQPERLDEHAEARRAAEHGFRYTEQETLEEVQKLAERKLRAGRQAGERQLEQESIEALAKEAGAIVAGQLRGRRRRSEGEPLAKAPSPGREVSYEQIIDRVGREREVVVRMIQADRPIEQRFSAKLNEVYSLLSEFQELVQSQPSRVETGDVAESREISRRVQWLDKEVNEFKRVFEDNLRRGDTQRARASLDEGLSLMRGHQPSLGQEADRLRELIRRLRSHS